VVCEIPHNNLDLQALKMRIVLYYAYGTNGSVALLSWKIRVQVTVWPVGWDRADEP
jgi:hypothetical protein